MGISTHRRQVRSWFAAAALAVLALLAWGAWWAPGTRRAVVTVLVLLLLVAAARVAWRAFRSRDPRALERPPELSTLAFPPSSLRH